MTDDRTLAERLYLLSFHEDNTRRQPGMMSPAGVLEYTLQAALIVELIERGQAAVVPSRGVLRGENFVLERSGFVPTGNAPLDALLTRIELPKNENKHLRNWMIAGSAQRHILEDLIARGVVSEHSEKVGRLKRVHRVVPADPFAVAALREEFYGVFLHDGEPQPRDYLLAALLVDGQTWEFVEPATGTPGMAHFLERLTHISDRYRPSWVTARMAKTPPATADDRGITRVLEALGRVNAPSS
jgi:hypothetical protein